MTQRYQNPLLNAVAATGAGIALAGDDRQMSGAEFQVTITGTATVTFEGNMDGGSTFYPVPVTSVTATPTTATTVTASGLYRCDASGLALLRPNVTAYTNGSVTVVGSLSTGTLSGGVSSGGGGGGTVSGSDADNAANSTTKLPVIPARANAAAQTWTEGHEVPLSTDLSGALRVNLVTDSTSNPTNPLTVNGTTATVKATPTITAGAYSAGNCVGGKLTLTSILRISNGTGTLAMIHVTDHANQKAPLDILIFDANPAATFTDHAASPTLAQADDAKNIMRVSIAATDYATVGGSASATKPVNLPVVGADSSQNLYAAVNTSGTPTYAATNDLTFTFSIYQD